MPTFKEYHLALQHFQSMRLRHDHADLAAIPQFQLLGEFFFEEMYGPHDFSERDAGARRVHHFMHLAPGVHIRDVEEALELLDISNELDEDLVHRLMAMEAPLDFDEQLYDEIYRQANNYDRRRHQIELVRSNIFNMHSLAHKPFLGIALRRAGFVARLAGLGVLHQFLLSGYTALRNVHDAHYFADTIYDRELVRLNRIYERG